jgi:type II secretory pathway component PulJ
MNLNDMARKAWVNGLIENFPRSEYEKLQWEVLEEMVIELEHRTRELVQLAEKERKRWGKP